MKSISAKHSLNSNTLKFIAIIAMTIDHIACVVFANYPAHLAVYGIIRILLYGNAGVMIGG